MILSIERSLRKFYFCENSLCDETKIDLHVIPTDAEHENQSTAAPVAETTAEVTAETATEAVVESTVEATVDGSAPVMVETAAATVPPPLPTPVVVPVENILIWPSMQDLNTRLRRVITSYQRNYKKEELKQQQKAKVNLSHYILHTVQQHHLFIYIFCTYF